MKVYIKKGYNNEFESTNCYLAYDGFRQMGWEVIFYTNIRLVKDNKPEDVIVGHIGDIRYSLKKFGCEIPALCYPEELKEYYGRKIWKSTLFTIANNPENWGIFIKPVYDAKRFTGTVVNSTKDLITCGGSLGDTEVWCSEVVNFDAEWRCYVRNGEILDIRMYKGEWRKHFNSNIVEEAIKKYETSPNGYGIDFGVTDKGETLVVEVNDGYSLGSYGLQSISYAKLLSARWAELTGTKDECDF